MRHSDASTFNDQLNIMALLLILLFLACFVALFFSPMIHEIVGAVSCLAVMWHCFANTGFFCRLFSGAYTRARLADTATTLLFTASFLVLMVSGCVLSSFLTPSFAFAADWNWVLIHLVSAIVSVVLAFVHMWREWAG